MKKAAVVLLSALMILALSVPAFADDVKATDISADVKIATVIQMYDGKLPIVRTDALFVPATSYTNTADNTENWKDPGNKIRDISIDEVDWQPYFYDDFLYDNEITDNFAMFGYDCIWSEIPGSMNYNFSVPKDDLYEFVVVGAGQITEANLDVDAKDRGFSFSIDGGAKSQVNLSDTLAIFREYTYSYKRADAIEAQIKTTNGENSKVYQMCYVYNIVVPLTRGEHVFNFYHLEYSGETNVSQSTSSRLNFAGFYVQRSLSDAELEAYTYPEITTLPEETTPEVTTAEQTTAEQTTAEEVVVTTPDEVVTTATPTPTVTTTASAPEKKGCGSFAACGAVIVALLGTAVVIRRKK